jgi:hypothetical protein
MANNAFVPQNINKTFFFPILEEGFTGFDYLEPKQGIIVKIIKVTKCFVTLQMNSYGLTIRKRLNDLPWNPDGQMYVYLKTVGKGKNKKKLAIMSHRYQEVPPKKEEDQTVLDMTNEEVVREFDELHAEEDPLCFENFDFDGWRKYMYERGNEEPEEAIDASYENHAEFHEEDGVWRINWEGEAPCEGSDYDSE